VVVTNQWEGGKVKSSGVKEEHASVIGSVWVVLDLWQDELGVNQVGG